MNNKPVHFPCRLRSGIMLLSNQVPVVSGTMRVREHAAVRTPSMAGASLLSAYLDEALGEMSLPHGRWGCLASSAPGQN